MIKDHRICGQHNHLHLIKSEQDCKNCEGQKYCLSFDLSAETSNSFKNIVKERGPIEIDDSLYRQQDKFKSIYSIQSGSIKTETITSDGRLSVMGFYLPGDIVGLDAISEEKYPNDAIAMETTWVCEIPYHSFLNLCCKEPRLQQRFIARLGKKIYQDEFDGKVVRNETACSRVMHFLFQLYWHQAQGDSPSRLLNIPMNKQDIASFLGLTPESFSRTLTKLEKPKYIQKESHKKLRLLKVPESEKLDEISSLIFK